MKKNKFEGMTDEQVKKVMDDAAETVNSARTIERIAKERHADCVAELMMRGHVVRMTF